MHARARRLTGITVAAAVMALAGAAAAVAGPTDESVAVASLLQAADVFPTATPSGVSLGGADDLPAFAANGGLREARQTWTSSEPIALVFDFRFQFADEASAVAFLDAAENDLAETSNGLALTPLPDPPLPDTRFYAVDLGSYGVNFNYLMHDGNLVAKVFVGGAGDVTQAQATEIARAAASRMIAALGGAAPSAGPSASATSSPSGSPNASPSASPVATAGASPLESNPPETAAPAASLTETPAPSFGPLESPSPLPSPDPSVVAAIIATVPDAVAQSCGPLLFTPEQPPRSGEVARVGCIAANGAGISLAAFDGADSVNAAFAAGELAAQLFGQLSTSGTCDGGGYDGTWTLDGAPAGQLLCYTLEGSAVIDWSDPAHLVLGSINQAVGDSAAAYEAWLAAGNGLRAPAN